MRYSLNFSSVSRPAVLPHDEFGDRRRIRRLAAPDQDRGASLFGSRRLERFVAHLVHTVRAWTLPRIATRHALAAGFPIGVQAFSPMYRDHRSPKLNIDTPQEPP